MQLYETVDEYMANFSGEAKKKLETIRQAIKGTAPEAKEKIGYGIPTYTLNGRNLIHFGGYPHHVSIYPGSAPIKDFEKDLVGYKTSKGTVQFPLDKPLPLELITKITLVCVERNQTKFGKK